MSREEGFYLHSCGTRTDQRAGRSNAQFAKLAQEARHAEDRESVFAKTGLAAGFANGILRAGLITKDELAQLVDMLNKAGSDRLAELDAKRKSVFHRIFKGAVL